MAQPHPLHVETDDGSSPVPDTVAITSLAGREVHTAVKRVALVLLGRSDASRAR